MSRVAAIILTFVVLTSSLFADIDEYRAVRAADFVWLVTPAGFLRYDKRSDELDIASPPGVSSDIQDIGIDEDTLWLATDDSISAMTIGAADWRIYRSDDCEWLENISAIGFHSDYVLVATASHIVRFDKYIEEWELVTDTDAPMQDLAIQGDTVWMIDANGVLSLDIDSPEVIRERSGESYSEIAVIGSKVWFIGANRIAGYDSLKGVWQTYPVSDEFGAPVSVDVEGNTIWVAYRRAIRSYDSKLDRWTDFLPFRSASVSGNIRSIDSAGDLWLLTETGDVARYGKSESTWQRLSRFDNLGDPVSIVDAGNNVLVTAIRGVAIYDKTRDTWREETYESLSGREKLREDKLLSFSPSGFGLSTNTFQLMLSGTNYVGFELNPEFGDFDYWNSLNLNGELLGREITGHYENIRDQRYKARYRGNAGDRINSVVVGGTDIRSQVSDLCDDGELLGAKLRTDIGPTKTEIWAGRDIGSPSVDFFRIELSERETNSFQLSHDDIVPYSEKVFVDDQLVQRNTHYIIDYSLGWLIFTDTDIINPDSRIRVQYQFEYSSDGFSGGVKTKLSSGSGNNEIGFELENRTFEQGAFSLGTGSARFGTDQFWLTPEIAWMQGENDSSPDLAGGIRLSLNTDELQFSTRYRRFADDFGSVVPRSSPIGDIEDSGGLHVKLHPMRPIEFRIDGRRDQSTDGEDTLVLGGVTIAPGSLPVIRIKARFDEIDVDGGVEKRVGGRFGIGYETPTEWLRKIHLDKLGFRADFGRTRMDQADVSSQRDDIYWRTHAGISDRFSINVSRKSHDLGTTEIRRTELGVYASPFSGITASLYLDDFSNSEGNKTISSERLLSASGAIMPGVWLESLGWIDLFMGYNEISRLNSSKTKSVSFRPVVRISRETLMFNNWQWNNQRGYRLMTEITRNSSTGRAGVDGTIVISEADEPDERKISVWQEFRRGKVTNIMRFGAISRSSEAIRWQPEHTLRLLFRRDGFFELIYLANSLGATFGNGNSIAESAFLELITSLRVSIRISLDLTRNLTDGETSMRVLFRSYLRL